jgi:16S rRNA (cytosine967-C5)-methyltransferase
LAALPEDRLSREDRSLTQELVLGVLRWQRTLDYFIERYSGRAPSGMDAAVRIALRIGLYQLRYLSRIPSHAAVNESVNLVKTGGAKSAAGLVNAVLRKAARQLSDQPDDQADDGIDDPGERAAIELSHPRWMIERWRTSLGESEAHALALANNAPPPVAFRVNTLRASDAEALDFLKAAGVNVRPSPIVPGGYVVEGGAAPAIADAVRRGMIYLQDQASQLVSLLLEPRAGDRILDQCAAPGSKTSHIANLTGNGAWIVAGDIHPHRIATLAAICKSLGVECVDLLVMDAAASELPFTAAFDRVLVDAPCTGTGTLRENPEIKWRLAPDDVTRLAKIQVRLLENASRVVAEGGRLVYSTCSIEREEGEDVVRQFLQTCPGFRLVQPKVDSSLVTADGFVRTYPHAHLTAGFFAAVLERIGGSIITG